MMDEESNSFLEAFKKKHRYSMSQTLRGLTNYYRNRENELLRILENEQEDDKEQ